MGVTPGRVSGPERDRRRCPAPAALRRGREKARPEATCRHERRPRALLVLHRGTLELGLPRGSQPAHLRPRPDHSNPPPRDRPSRLGASRTGRSEPLLHGGGAHGRSTGDSRPRGTTAGQRSSRAYWRLRVVASCRCAQSNPAVSIKRATTTDSPSQRIGRET